MAGSYECPGGSRRRELLYRMLIIGVQHLRYVVIEYQTHHSAACRSRLGRGSGGSMGSAESR